MTKGRYFLSPDSGMLSLSWPNGKDLRDALLAGRMTYPSYSKAILAGPGQVAATLLAVCPAGSSQPSCAAFLGKSEYSRLAQAIPFGVRVEIYDDVSVDLRVNQPGALSQRILAGACKQLKNPAVGLRADARLPSLAYPGGDIQPDFASSTDVVIRAVRFGGVDLQALVHEDILRHPEYYAGLDLGVDRAASHRLFPVLQTFFAHNTMSLPTDCVVNPYSFEGGDIVFFPQMVPQSRIRPEL